MNHTDRLRARAAGKSERFQNKRINARGELIALVTALETLLNGGLFDQSERAQLEICVKKLAAVTGMLP